MSPAPLARRGFFVTATDTGAGKTHVVCALLQAYAKYGYRVAGMKPVAAGGGILNEDIVRLRAASNVAAPPELVCPYPLQAGIAPHVAADQEGVRIDLQKILQSYGHLKNLADVIIVEGIGGFKVPLNDTEDSAELAKQLKLPMILVVGMRLGCLNHALLTAEAIQKSGLQLTAWVANHIDPNMEALDENVAALKQRIPAPLLGALPHRLDLCAGVLDIEVLREA